MSAARLIWRGCGHLPHVGDHPGSGFLIGMIVIGGTAAADKGWLGIAVGAGMMAAVFAPMYLWGAYERAKISERLSARDSVTEARSDETPSRLGPKGEGAGPAKQESHKLNL